MVLSGKLQWKGSVEYILEERPIKCSRVKSNFKYYF